MATVTKESQQETQVEDGPEEPSDVPARGWWAVLKRTFAKFREHDLTDWAASLTYYAMLALFPALLALVSIVGLAGQSATKALVDNVSTLTGGPARDVISGAIKNLSHSGGTAGVAYVIGILLALWAASGHID